MMAMSGSSVVEFINLNLEDDGDDLNPSKAPNLAYESSDEECIQTFPYMNDSESEGENNGQDSDSDTSSSDVENDISDSEIDVITLDDFDQTEQLKKKLKENGHLICLRCPQDRNSFKDIKMYLSHTDRHVGTNHFVCQAPKCLKPFIKFSFCLAHEIRKHGQNFPEYDFPAVIMAREYIKVKEELKLQKKAKTEAKMKKKLENNPDSTSIDNPESPPSPPEDLKIFEEIGGILEDNKKVGLSLAGECLEDDDETDEDDPQFYPGYAVPSTSLYPYRGPLLDAPHECYEVQLKFGRKKKTAINTISRLALVHRQHLKKNGLLRDEGESKFFYRNTIFNSSSNVIVKPNKREKRKRKDDPLETCSVAVKSSGKRKRILSDAESSIESSSKPQSTTYKPPRRKKQRKTNDKKERTARRTFCSSVITRTCLLCDFIWNTEVDLRNHREEKHPSRKLLDLMTVLTKDNELLLQEDDSELEINDENNLFIPVNIRKKRKLEKNTFLPLILPDPQKESFLAKLGLISKQKLEQLRLKKKKDKSHGGRRLRKRVKKETQPCKVVLELIPSSKIGKNGRVFVCDICDYFTGGKNYLLSHKLIKHKLSPTKLKLKLLKTREKK